MKKLLKAFCYEEGRLSSTRVWKHIAYAVATYSVLKMGAAVTWEILALYLMVIAADNRAGAIIRKKFETRRSATYMSAGDDSEMNLVSTRRRGLNQKLSEMD